MPLSAAPPCKRLLLPLCLVAACVEAFAASPVALKADARLASAAPAGPTQVEADRLEGHAERDLVAEGRVILSNPRERIEADWLRYDQIEDEARARGKVVFIRDRDRVEGSELRLKLSDRLGEMRDVSFQLHSDDGKYARGATDRLEFAGRDVYRMERASYTTCRPGDDDWYLRTDSLELDYVASLGSARKVSIEYLGTPILYAPWMDFALDDRRKSGFLTPAYGVSNERGLELIAPWYWNIAPNRDATITPRLMTRRGLQLGGEFRYLEPDYGGDVSVELLPGDAVAKRTRYRGLLRHRHRFDARWSGDIEYETVSDDLYFAELSNLVNQTSRVNLPRQGSLHYDGGWWRASGLVQRYQTLQDPKAPIVEPYHRVPRLTLSASQPRLMDRDMRFDFAGEFTYFDHQAGTRVQGGRLYAYPSLSFPMRTAYASVTPRLGWHLSRYVLEDDTRGLADSLAVAPAGGFEDANLSLPVFSLDSSLFLERDLHFRGRDFIQTLEPRLFYVYAPYREQSRIPVFDSGDSDLSFDQLFTENNFNGVDRFNDANQLTLALTSRFLDHDTGVERLQVTFGQRYYFSTPRVALPGQKPRESKATDLLAQIGGQVTPRLRFGAGVQYDTDSGDLVKANLGGGWRDGPGRAINADYRYTRDSVDQIDVSFQWPLAPNWYGLGRLNYSIRDRSLVEGLAGFEYNAGCWTLRGVLQRLATTENKDTSAFFLQLELRGLTKLGPNPHDVLKRSISGYVQSSEFIQDPRNGF